MSPQDSAIHLIFIIWKYDAQQNRTPQSHDPGFPLDRSSLDRSGKLSSEGSTETEAETVIATTGNSSTTPWVTPSTSKKTVISTTTTSSPDFEEIFRLGTLRVSWRRRRRRLRQWIPEGRTWRCARELRVDVSRLFVTALAGPFSLVLFFFFFCVITVKNRGGTGIL